MWKAFEKDEPAPEYRHEPKTQPAMKTVFSPHAVSPLVDSVVRERIYSMVYFRSWAYGKGVAMDSLKFQLGPSMPDSTVRGRVASGCLIPS
jgi:hypothetical protein